MEDLVRTAFLARADARHRAELAKPVAQQQHKWYWLSTCPDCLIAQAVEDIKARERS